MRFLFNFNYLQVTLIALISLNNFENGLCLECSSSQKSSPDPEVTVLKITNGTTSPEQNGTFAIFEQEEAVQFRLECKSHVPVKWVFDEDFYERGVKNIGNTLTTRTVRNFTDEKAYEFLAPYELQIDSKTRKPLILFCQTVQHPCQRRVVVSSFDEEIKKYRVKLLTKMEETLPDVIDFETELTTSHNDSASCPLKLTLHFNQIYNALVYYWTPSESVASFKQESAQSLENSFRLAPILEEGCINFVVDLKALLPCPQCTQIDFKIHQQKPAVLYNAVGDNRRILKGFFDIATPRNFYYIWEQVDPQNLIRMTVPKEAYRGQKLKITCDTSVFLFSYGSQIGWNKIGDTFPVEFVSWDDIDNKTIVTDYGTIRTAVGVRPSKTYLDENGVRSLNVSCIAPIWNSTVWVTQSKIVPLIDSMSPEIINKSKPSTSHVIVGQNFSFKCEAEGFPAPTLDILPPQDNLNFTINQTTNGNHTELIVTISKIELTYEGNYTCVAESVVGKDSKIFLLKITPGLSQFVKFILIGAGVLTLIFLVIATLLILKLRKEKEEFRRLTEEAILKFQEGFKNTIGIGFDSKAEYKDYEIPFGRWEMSGTILGSGAFGIVQKGVIAKGREKTVLAIKTVNAPKDIGEFESSLMELTIMSYIGRHENIVSLIAACTENIHKRSVYIGVEFCSNGDLSSYLQKRRSLFHSLIKDGQFTKDLSTEPNAYVNVVNTTNFSTLDLYKWSYEIANGMDFLESKKILHADLAARNVLLTEDKTAKISDFGLSRKLLDSSNYTKKTSSPLPWRWMAIESLKFQQFSSKSDVWSYGVTLYEVFSLGLEPWPNQGWTIEFVNELEAGRRLSRPNYATDNMYDLIMLECWRNEPEERLTFAKARDYFQREISSLNPTEEGKEMDSSYMELS